MIAISVHRSNIDRLHSKGCVIAGWLILLQPRKSLLRLGNEYDLCICVIASGTKFIALLSSATVPEQWVLDCLWWLLNWIQTLAGKYPSLPERVSILRDESFSSQDMGYWVYAVETITSFLSEALLWDWAALQDDNSSNYIKLYFLPSPCYSPRISMNYLFHPSKLNAIGSATQQFSWWRYFWTIQWSRVGVIFVSVQSCIISSDEPPENNLRDLGMWNFSKNGIDWLKKKSK